MGPFDNGLDGGLSVLCVALIIAPQLVAVVLIGFLVTRPIRLVTLLQRLALHLGVTVRPKAKTVSQPFCLIAEFPSPDNTSSFDSTVFRPTAFRLRPSSIRYWALVFSGLLVASIQVNQPGDWLGAGTVITIYWVGLCLSTWPLKRPVLTRLLNAWPHELNSHLHRICLPNPGIAGYGTPCPRDIFRFLERVILSISIPLQYIFSILAAPERFRHAFRSTFRCLKDLLWRLRHHRLPSSRPPYFYGYAPRELLTRLAMQEYFQTDPHNFLGYGMLRFLMIWLSPSTLGYISLYILWALALLPSRPVMSTELLLPATTWYCLTLIFFYRQWTYIFDPDRKLTARRVQSILPAQVWSSLPRDDNFQWLAKHINPISILAVLNTLLFGMYLILVSATAAAISQPDRPSTEPPSTITTP